MTRYIHIKDGFVTNIVEYPNGPLMENGYPRNGDLGELVMVDPGNINVGSAFDVTDELQNRRFDKLEAIIFFELRRLTNEVRALKLVFPDPLLTIGQYRAYIKSLF